MDSNEVYLNSVHKSGKIWNISVMVILLAFPFVVAMIFNAKIDASGLWLGLLATAPLYWIVGVVETITYIPMLGAGGSYLSFVTGNISNLKLPCAINSLEQAEVSASSQEGEIVSTISIAVSSIVTTIIIAIGVLLIKPLTPILEAEVLEPAFANLIPALFGALGVAFISKNWKVAIFPCVLMIVLFVAIPALNHGTVAVMVPISVILTLGLARLLYKKGMLD